MVKKVIWSTQARTDRKDILEYWRNRNKSDSYPTKLNLLFKDAVNTISAFPKIGKPTFHKDTRIKIVRDYFMVYKEHEDYISILRIWDSRQNPIKLQPII